MPVDVVMPQMGESIVEGTLTKWLKKPGEQVQRDEPLFEISTDKVDTEIPSPAAGTLSEVLVEAGATVSINTVVARIAEGGEAAAPADAGTTSVGTTPEAAPPAAAPGPAIQGSDSEPLVAREAAPDANLTEREIEQQIETPAEADAGNEADAAGPAGPLSPLVRRMAREYSIDLKQVKGTGAGGRITKQDLEGYMASQGAKTMSQPTPVAPAGAGGYPAVPEPSLPPSTQAQPAPDQKPVMPQAAPQQPPAAPPKAPAPAPQPGTAPPAQPGMAPPAQPGMAPPAQPGMAKTRVEPMSIMRQKIAEHMVMSKRTSPHVTTVHKVDMTKVAKLRERNKGEVQAKYGFGLTFLPFVARATVVALQALPILNASVEGNSIIYHNEINLGIAVALEGGLIVPVIRNADEKNILGLQRSIVDLAARARSRQLKPDDIAGGTFTISNYGSGGSIIGTPVINQPQVAILGVGAVEKQPVVVDDAIAIRSICYLSLSFDHRLIDGALADEFVSKIKAVLQDFSEQVL